MVPVRTHPQAVRLCHTISAGCYRISVGSRAVVIEFQILGDHSDVMKKLVILTAAAALMALAQPAVAQCYADYKAKQDNPLRLHYGVVQLQGPCSAAAAQSEISARIARGGWTLLNVMSVFGSEGLNERKDSAGPYFLRF